MSETNEENEKDENKIMSHAGVIMTLMHLCDESTAPLAYKALLSHDAALRAKVKELESQNAALRRELEEAERERHMSEAPKDESDFLLLSRDCEDDEPCVSIVYFDTEHKCFRFSRTNTIVDLARYSFWRPLPATGGTET